MGLLTLHAPSPPSSNNTLSGAMAKNVAAVLSGITSGEWPANYHAELGVAAGSPNRQRLHAGTPPPNGAHSDMMYPPGSSPRSPDMRRGAVAGVQPTRTSFAPSSPPPSLASTPRLQRQQQARKQSPAVVRAQQRSRVSSNGCGASTHSVPPPPQTLIPAWQYPPQAAILSPRTGQRLSVLAQLKPSVPGSNETLEAEGTPRGGDADTPTTRAVARELARTETGNSWDKLGLRSPEADIGTWAANPAVAHLKDTREAMAATTAAAGAAGAGGASRQRPATASRAQAGRGAASRLARPKSAAAAGSRRRARNSVEAVALAQAQQQAAAAAAAVATEKRQQQEAQGDEGSTPTSTPRTSDEASPSSKAAQLSTATSVVPGEATDPADMPEPYNWRGRVIRRESPRVSQRGRTGQLLKIAGGGRERARMNVEMGAIMGAAQAQWAKDQQQLMEQEESHLTTRAAALAVKAINRVAPESVMQAQHERQELAMREAETDGEAAAQAALGTGSRPQSAHGSGGGGSGAAGGNSGQVYPNMAREEQRLQVRGISGSLDVVSVPGPCAPVENRSAQATHSHAHQLTSIHHQPNAAGGRHHTFSLPTSTTRAGAKGSRRCWRCCQCCTRTASATACDCTKLKATGHTHHHLCYTAPPQRGHGRTRLPPAPCLRCCTPQRRLPRRG